MIKCHSLNAEKKGKDSEHSAQEHSTDPLLKNEPQRGRNSGMNSLKRVREQLLMSKAELARKAGVSPLTIDRIERGKNCRMETKRKIILALGYTLEEKAKIFGDDD
jgi:DNA-binding XRE family transcriptional regulator